MANLLFYRSALYITKYLPQYKKEKNPDGVLFLWELRENYLFFFVAFFLVVFFAAFFFFAIVLILI
jgi:hypothetical protein